MESLLKREKFVNVIYIVLGVFLLSAGINIFFAPNNIVMGGFSGIAIILQRLTEGIVEGGFPISATNLVLNIPLLWLLILCLAKDIWGKLL